MLVLPRALLATALVAAAAGAARAQAVEGFYVGAGAGLNVVQGSRVTLDALPGGGGAGTGKLGWDPGYVVSGALGYGFGNGLRLELQGDYRNVQQNRNGGGGGGRQVQVGGMGNMLFDIDIDSTWAFPYVGFGGGYQSVTWHRIGLAAGGLGGGATPVSANATAGGLAWQAMLGSAFPLAAVPGLSLTVEYRYLNMPASRSYRASVPSGTQGGASAGSATRVHNGDDANHSLLVGLRYAFDTQEAAPVARPPLAAETGVPLPPPLRTYLVFFDWDSADLSPRAREIVAEAVRNAPRIAHTRIEVAGHADRSGTAKGNQALSLRRAQAVAAELQRQGIAPDTIDMHGYGDTRPLVPTAAGAREPQNRRVEIVYR